MKIEEANFRDALRERHVLYALKLCESCGHPGASPSDQIVLDSAGARPRYLCKEPLACVRRLHSRVAGLGWLTGEVEETRLGLKKVFVLRPSGRRLLSEWRERCHRGIPQWAL